MPIATATEAAAPVTESAAPATASPDALKTGRRQSFFNTLGSRKEKKSDAISDTENTDGEGKKSASSKLGGLFRKPSRARSGNRSSEATKTTPVPAISKDLADAPSPISKDVPSGAGTMTNGESTAAPKTVAAHESIGDVGPEAITSGHATHTPVEASA